MKATIKAVKKSEKGFYTFLANDVWYGNGKKSPGEKGDTVEFDVEENGDFKNAKNLRKAEGAQVADPPKASLAGGTDWAKKDAMISFQAARNAANALLSIAVQAGFSDAPDTYSKLKTESDKLTKAFFEQTSNLGGAGGSKPAYKPDPDDPLNQDSVPF